MYVEVHLSDKRSRISLGEPDDFGRFKVLIRGSGDESSLAVALAGVGRPSGRDAAWILPDAIRELAPAAGDPAWEASFRSMLASAQKHGWVDEETGAVRAHCEWASKSDEGD